MSGTAVALKSSGATVVGRAGSASGQPVAMTHGVGLGRSVTLAWNTETSVSQAFYLSLLEAAAPASGHRCCPGVWPTCGSSPATPARPAPPSPSPTSCPRG
jgi:hypothetical protein